MAIKVEIRINRVTYKCFACLQLKNPDTEVPHVIVVVTNVRPNPAGQVDLMLGNALICPTCFANGEKDKKFVDAAKISKAQPFVDKKGISDERALS